MINQLPSCQQAFLALRVRKKQPAPMRVLAAACRFLGRLLFLLGLSLRGRQPADRIFIVPDGAIQGVLSSAQHGATPAGQRGGSGQRGATPAGLSPNRAQVQQGQLPAGGSW